MEHGARLHAKYSASGASRFFACPGSIRLTEGLEDKSSPWALEGTHAHELMELALREGSADAGIYAGTQVGDRHVTIETATAVNVALDLIEDLMAEDPAAVMFLETRFNFPQDVVPQHEASGLADVVIYQPTLRRLHVIDYKHGAGVAVSVHENKQLLYYAAGCLFALDLAVAEVTMWIVQPRAAHPDGQTREHTVTPGRLIDYIAEVEEAIERCEQPDAPLVVNLNEQCRWCPAKENLCCPALEKQAMAVTGLSDPRQIGVEVLPPPGMMPIDRLAYILRAAPILKAWLKECEAAAAGMASRGVLIPGYKLVQPHGRRAWHGEPEEIAQALVRLSGGRMTYEDVFPRRLITLTDAESELKTHAASLAPRGKKKEAKEQATEAMAALTHKEPPAGLSLVPEEDGRPAVNPTLKAFGDIQLPLIESYT